MILHLKSVYLVEAVGENYLLAEFCNWHVCVWRRHMEYKYIDITVYVLACMLAYMLADMLVYMLAHVLPQFLPRCWPRYWPIR